MFRCSIVKGDKASINDKEYILTWVNKFYKNEKWHYEALSRSNKMFGKEYFTRNEDYAKMIAYSNHAKIIIEYNNDIQEGLYPKIHIQKNDVPIELMHQTNTKWIKKLNLLKYRKKRNIEMLSRFKLPIVYLSSVGYIYVGFLHFFNQNFFEICHPIFNLLSL